ncbi:MAG: hypothetical protein ACM3Q4_12450 [Acidobacteriota bacterium]
MRLSLVRSNNLLHTVKSTASLRDAIRVLEETKAVQEKELKYQFEETLESLKPKNLARSAVTRLSESPRVRHSLLSGAASFFTGYLSRRLLVGAARGPFRKMIGSALQFGVTALIAKYKDELEVAFRNLLLRLLGGRKEHMHMQHV